MTWYFQKAELSFLTFYQSWLGLFGGRLTYFLLMEKVQFIAPYVLRSSVVRVSSERSLDFPFDFAQSMLRGESLDVTCFMSAARCFVSVSLRSA